MRNLVFLLFLGVVVFLFVGWILDWYNFTSVKNSDGKTSITVDFNGTKIKDDINRGTQKLNDTIHNLQDDKNKPSQPTGANRGPSGIGS